MTKEASLSQADADSFDAQGRSVQQIASIIAAGIAEAYSAAGSGNTPTLNGYGSITTIWVYLDFGSSAAAARGERNPKRRFRVVRPGEDTSGIDFSLASLFGFTAVSDDYSNNLLVLRGTATATESADDLIGFDEDMIPCLLPTNPDVGISQQPYGNVNNKYYDFYAYSVDTYDYSLAQSCAEAIRAAEGANTQTHNWYIGGHSLGGAMIALFMLDSEVDTTIFSSGTDKKIVVTFGSAYTGDQLFVDSFGMNKVLWLRMANLSDFVPSFNADLPPPPAPQPYVHVGYPITFTWQWWDDWKNHSLTDTYQEVVNNYWNVVAWTQPTYPH